jgi:hypothetical protein
LDFEDTAADISRKAGVSLGSATEADLRRLADVGAPESIVSFYRQYEPKAAAEIGNARLWPIVDIIAENTDYVPGADLRPHGFVTFATTIYGDAYCFDTGLSEHQSDAPVVLMSHEVNWEALDRAAILSCRKRVAGGFDEFLSRFVGASLETEPEYPTTSE